MKHEELKETMEYSMTYMQLDVYNMLAEYMRRHGLNQTQLAARLGISKGYVSQIMRGDCDFRMSTLTAIAQKLGYAPRLQFTRRREAETGGAAVRSAAATYEREAAGV